MTNEMTINKTQPRATDHSVNFRQRQRLAIAAGMTLSDGSPIVVGGPKCPATHKITKAINFNANRMTREEFSDAQDDYGAVRPYWEATFAGNDEVRSIMAEWSGLSDCDGEIDMMTFLQIS